MIKSLQEAFAEAAKLPEKDQDAFAEFLLAELHCEERWARAFTSSADELATLAREALEDYRSGRTRTL